MNNHPLTASSSESDSVKMPEILSNSSAGMGNKKLIIGVCVATVVVLAGAGFVYAKFFTQSKPATTTNTSGLNASGATGRNAFSSIQGKILSISGKTIVVDSQRGQTSATLDDKTIVTETIPSTSGAVIKEGNTVSIRYTTDQDNTMKVMSVMTVSETQFTQQTPSNGAQPSGGAQGTGRRGNFSGQQNQFLPSGTPSAARERMAVGKITTITGNKVAITPIGNTPTPSTQEFDITGATFQETKTVSLSALKEGQSVRGFGSKSGDTTLLRTLQIEAI